MSNVEIVIFFSYLVLSFMYFCSLFIPAATIVSTNSEFKDAVVLSFAVCYYWSTATNDSSSEFFTATAILGLGLYIIWRIQSSKEETTSDNQ